MKAAICNVCGKLLVNEVRHVVSFTKMTVDDRIIERDEDWDLCKRCYEKVINLKEDKNNA
jgi:hypothetical protein